MTPPDAVAAGCTGKERFRSWTAAERIATRRNRIKDATRLTAYRCRFCQGFHIGGQTKW